MKTILGIILGVGLICSMYAETYNNNYGPFTDDSNIKLLTLTKLKYKPDEADILNPKYIFPILDQKNSRLDLVMKSGTWYAQLMINGKVVMPPSAFSDYGTVGGMMAYSTDLNQDQVSDYIIYSYSSGCGLASGYCNVAFILSSDKQYNLTTITTLFPDENGFIVLNDKPYFIHTSVLGVNNCKDGKYHNFWIYNLLGFNKNKVSICNNLHSTFPKTIWYTFKPNHKESTIITGKQKNKLHKQSLLDLYWQEKDINSQ